MATIDVLNKDGARVAEITPREDIFDGRVNEALFHEVVRMQLASRRSGSASTKTRGEVSGSNRKPWRQKGTGRARAGTRKSPLWRHGGTIFGPKPRDYSYSMPKKAVKAALRSALQYKINEGKLKVFESLEVAEPKTKAALATFRNAGLSNALIVIEGADRNLNLATRNLMDFKLLDVQAINVYDILRFDELVMTRAAYEAVVSRLSR